MGLLTVLLGVAAAAVAPVAHGAVAASTARTAFSKTETITRSHLVNNRNKTVDKRTFAVTVGQTKNLRDRQEIRVAWSGAHPTGGVVADPNSALAAQQEYPVVLMMCRGSASQAPASKQITPQTCWTQTPQERFQFSSSNYPSYRLDRYASVHDRALSVGAPSPYPHNCPKSPGAQHWIPFVAANGKVYEGGPDLGCAGNPPEAANASASLQPGNTTYAATGSDGKGSAKFVITTSETNASLGCSDSVPCSLEIVPIMGISCDPSGNSVPPSDRPPSGDVRDKAYADCSARGQYAVGQPSSGLPETEDLAVSGELWWSASNWRNRVTVPLSFAPPSNVCSLVNKAAPTDIYGSYLMLQATQQWAPHFCLNPKLFSLQHVQTSEPEAKNLLQTGSIGAAFQGSSPPTAFTKPVVQAPTAITGFAITYAIDDAKGRPYLNLHLDARLLAKLLTESYTSNSTFQSQDTALRNPKTNQPNPLDLDVDPEFRALNPGMPKNVSTSEAAATLLSISSDSDLISALTSYIDADPEARAWVNGKPDPWGMIVNPKYRGIKLPVTNFPLLDTFEPSELYASDKNPCLARNPVPWLPLVASPVENPATITLDMQFDIANPQIQCANAGQQNQKLTAIGREAPGQRFLLGITSLADAARYQLQTAALETQGGSTTAATFSSGAGRSFAAPTSNALRAAATLLHPNPTVGSWPVPYAKLRTEPAGKAAYPGTMLVSTDVPTSGLKPVDAQNYAAFLNFAAADGQVPGLDNGQLPAGYLPMTAANGLGNLANYTKAAAQAVAAQRGQLPSLTGPFGSSPGSSSSSPGSAPSSNGAVATGPGSTSGSGTTSPAASGGTPSDGASPAPSDQSTPTAALGTTVALRSSTAGLVFPLVLLLALIAGTITIGLWRLDRPRRTA